MISVATLYRYMIDINDQFCVHGGFSRARPDESRLNMQLSCVSCRLTQRDQQQSAASTASLPPFGTCRTSSIAWLATGPTRLPLLEELAEVVASESSAGGLRPQAAQGAPGGPGTGSTCSASRRGALRRCTWQLVTRVRPCLHFCMLGA